MTGQPPTHLAPRALGLPILALSLARLVAALGAAMVIVALPLSVHELPAGALFGRMSEEARVGLLVSAFGLLLAGTQPIVGRLADRRLARKTIVLVGLGSFGVSSLLLHFASAYWHLLLLRAAQGVSVALTAPTTLSLISTLAPPERRGFALGLYGSARMTGFGLGPLLGGALLLAVSMPTAYALGAVPAVLAVFLVALGVPGAGTQSAPPRAGGEGAPPDGGAPAPPDDRLFPFLVLAATFFVSACCVSSMVVLENQFIARLDQTTLGFGAAISAMIITRMVLDWPVGWLCDRAARRPLMVAGLLIMGPSTAALGFVGSTAQLIAARAVMGVGMALVSTPCFALAADRAIGSGATFRLSILTSGFGFGLAIGPLATGLLAARTGLWPPFVAIGGLSVLMAPVTFALVQEAPRPRAVEAARDPGHHDPGAPDAIP